MSCYLMSGNHLNRVWSGAYIATSMLLSSINIANADSGTSALPPKDPAYKTRMYNLYAPKTQTNFKQFQVVTQTVDSITKQNDKVMVFGGRVVNGAAVVAGIGIVSKNPMIVEGATLVAAAGGALALVGDFGKASVEQFKQDAIVKDVVYFKWTNPDNLEYAIKVDSWVEYKGARVSSITTSQYTKSF